MQITKKGNQLAIEIDSIFNLVFDNNSTGLEVKIEHKDWVDQEVDDETVLGLTRQDLFAIQEWCKTQLKK
jgi:uncharacterized protein YdeI (BOF family)